MLLETLAQTLTVRRVASRGCDQSMWAELSGENLRSIASTQTDRSAQRPLAAHLKLHSAPVKSLHARSNLKEGAVPDVAPVWPVCLLFEIFYKLHLWTNDLLEGKRESVWTRACPRLVESGTGAKRNHRSALRLYSTRSAHPWLWRSKYFFTDASFTMVLLLFSLLLQLFLVHSWPETWSLRWRSGCLAPVGNGKWVNTRFLVVVSAFRRPVQTHLFWQLDSKIYLSYKKHLWGSFYIECCDLSSSDVDRSFVAASSCFLVLSSRLLLVHLSAGLLISSWYKPSSQFEYPDV